MDPCVQILKFTLKVCLVVLPRQAVYSGRGVSLEGRERQLQQVAADMVEERGEPFLLPLLCGLPYAVQRPCHALPVPRPERALPARVSLGPRPSLDRQAMERILVGAIRECDAGQRLICPLIEVLSAESLLPTA
jgi:hypothetical protein